MITNATYTRTIPKEKYGTESLSVDIAKSADKTIEESIFEAVAFVNFQLKLTVKPASSIPEPEKQPDISPKEPEANSKSFDQRVSECVKMFKEIEISEKDLEKFLGKLRQDWVNGDLTKLAKNYTPMKTEFQNRTQPKKEA